jgi:hypothetical protein
MRGPVDDADAGRPLAAGTSGARHGTRRQFVRDRRRLNALVAAGRTGVLLTADLSDPADPVARANTR